MNYNEILTKISREIRTRGGQIDLEHYVSLKTKNNIKVYKNNYFAIVRESLCEDFIGTFRYLGENNFNYFVNIFLNNDGLRSPNIFDISEPFLELLKNELKMHKDFLLIEIAKLDFLWSSDSIKEKEFAYGTLFFWKDLIEDKIPEIEVDFSKKEKIKIIERDGEKAFKLLK